MFVSPEEILFNYKYNIVYGITAVIALFFVVEFTIKNRSHTKIQNIILLGVLAAFVILFGTRGELVGKDTGNNIKYFVRGVPLSSMDSLNDIGLYSVSMFMSKYTNNLDVFLVAVAILYIAPIYIMIKNLKLRNPLIFLLCLVSFFFFKSMGINIQKQGIAFSFFICGLSYLFLSRRAWAYGLFLIAFLFHASIIIPVTMFLLFFKIKKTNVMIALYIICTILAIVNFNFNMVLSQIPVVNMLTESRLEMYYNDVGNYKIGFRPEFWLFNTIFAIIGWITLKNIKHFNLGWLTDKYKIIYITYMGLSSFFFLMFSARFSDRFGVLAWTLIPFILLPYIQSSKTFKLLNTMSVYILCVFIFIIFKFI